MEGLICPYKMECYIANIEALSNYFATILTDNGTKEPKDGEIENMIKIVTTCDKSHCAAWHKSEIYSDDKVLDYGWCARAKGEFE